MAAPGGATALTRRDVLQQGVALAAGALLAARSGVAAEASSGTGAAGSLITRAIPSTGERVPVIGIGTNSFSEGGKEVLRQVLARFSAMGATMVDTAASYGESEQVIGALLEELGLRDRLFLATKFTAAGGAQGGAASVDRSLQRLRTSHLDLLYVHNLQGTDQLFPLMQEWKQAKRVRYLGVSTSSTGQHAGMVEQMKKYPLDVVEVNYGIADRDAERTVLKVAAERRIAVVANVPFGGRGGRTLTAVLGKPLPPWAAEIGCTSWAQLMLKYAASHPAVTCVITGMTKASHVEDNLQAAHGVLPDAAMRRRMEQYWDTLG